MTLVLRTQLVSVADGREDVLAVNEREIPDDVLIQNLTVIAAMAQQTPGTVVPMPPAR